MMITTVQPEAACGRRIGAIAAITRQIGRMRRRAADAPADYEPTFSRSRHTQVFFITEINL